MDLKGEAKRARHEILGWKNLFFGWSTWSSLGEETSRSGREVKHLLQALRVLPGAPPALPQTFEQVVAKLRLTADKLQALASRLRLRSAWWSLATAIAFVSLALAPLSRHSFTHGMMAAALMFFCATRALAWYFRACQVQDQTLYDFQSWWRTNRTLKRLFAVLIGVLVVGLLLMTGVAHASPIQQGFAPDPQDPSVSALRSVFGGIVDTVLGNGDPHQDGMDSALGAMMVPLNASILTLTMVFAGYASMRTIIDTAHTGDFMGRKQDISGYVIGRIFLGVGLLVPLGSGYSLIQYGMMWWSLQGAGLGNQVNTAALDYMGNHKEGMIAEPKVPSADAFVQSVLKARVCMAAMNLQYEADGDNTRIAMKSSTNQIKPASQSWWQRFKGQVSYQTADIQQHPMLNLIPVVGQLRMFSNVGAYNDYRQQWETSHTFNSYRYSFDAVGSDYTNPEGVCGSFTFSNPANTDMDASPITQSIIDAQNSAVQTILNSDALTTLANTIAGADNQAPSADTRFSVHQQIQQLSDTYSNAVVQAVESQGGVSGMSDSEWTQFVNAMKQTGWAYLPSYYNQLIRANDNVQMALNAMPEMNSDRVTAFASKAELTTYNDAMTRLDEFLQTPADLIQANASKVGGIDLNSSWYSALYDQCVSKTEDAEKAKEAAVSNSSANSAYSHMQKCLSVIPRRALLSFTDALMGGNLNHIVHIKAIGDTIIGIGDGIITANFLLNTFTGNAAGRFLGAHAGVASLGGLFTTLALALLTFGAIAAYYIPLIPYINGTVAFVKWLTLVIESIIAGPIFAAAHAFPEGHEIAGSAGPGYRLLIGLLLRPALTVMGFFLAIIVAQPVADLINTTYGNAVMGAESGSITGITAFLAYVVIYVTIMTTVMHSVFSLINWVPDNVLRWVGAGLQAHGVGDQETNETKGNVLAAFRGGNHISTESMKSKNRDGTGKEPPPLPSGNGPKGGFAGSNGEARGGND